MQGGYHAKFLYKIVLILCVNDYMVNNNQPYIKRVATKIFTIINLKKDFNEKDFRNKIYRHAG